MDCNTPNTVKLAQVPFENELSEIQRITLTIDNIILLNSHTSIQNQYEQ